MLQSKLQLEANELQANDILKLKCNEIPISEFWSKFVSDSEYPSIKQLAIAVLSMFGSTYTCESAFSITLSKLNTEVH